MRFAFIHNSFSFSCCFRLLFFLLFQRNDYQGACLLFPTWSKIYARGSYRRSKSDWELQNGESNISLWRNEKAPPLVFRIIHKIVNTPGFWPTSRPCKTMGQRQRRWFEWFRPKVSQPVLSTNRFSVSILLLTWLILCTIFVNKVTHDSRQEKKIIQTRLPS